MLGPGLLWLALTACGGGDTYIVEGTVVEVQPPARVVLDHKEVAGLMGAMVMPFDVAEPSMIVGLEPGDLVLGRFQIDQEGGRLVKLRVTGKGVAPPPLKSGPEPISVGALLPRFEVETRGGPVVIGEGAGVPTALTFVYTRCPVPEFCPTVMARQQALRAKLPDGAQMVTVTLDPAYDSLDVLDAYGQPFEVDGQAWRLGRLPEPELERLAMYAAMPILRETNEIVHGLRLLIVDADGKLVGRYDDHSWSLDEVVASLGSKH